LETKPNSVSRRKKSLKRYLAKQAFLVFPKVQHNKRKCKAGICAGWYSYSDVFGGQPPPQRKSSKAALEKYRRLLEGELRKVRMRLRTRTGEVKSDKIFFEPQFNRCIIG